MVDPASRQHPQVLLRHDQPVDRPELGQGIDAQEGAEVAADRVQHDAVADRPFGSRREVAEMAEARVGALEGSEVGRQALHLERQLVAEDLLDLLAPAGVVFRREEQVEQWTPEVVRRPRVIKPEHIGARPQAGGRVRKVREVAP